MRPRAYYNQPVWKRVVVILAGPAVNLLIAFVIIWALYPVQRASRRRPRQVAQVQKATPAAAKLQPGDQIVVGGRGRAARRTRFATSWPPTAAPAPRSTAAWPRRRPASWSRRGGQLLTFELRPRYSAAEQRPLLGFAFAARQQPVGAAHAASPGRERHVARDHAAPCRRSPGSSSRRSASSSTAWSAATR